MMWPVVILASLGAFATKWAGHLLPESALQRESVRRAAALLPVALLSALLAVQAVWGPSGPQVDARLPGVGVAIVLLALRAPFLVVVLAAAATAAALRAIGWG